MLLSGRGVLLGEDGSLVALAISQNVDSADDPLTDTYTGPKKPQDGQTAPGAPKPSDPVNPDAQAVAKHRAFLKSLGYTDEKAERLTKLVYG
jgi:hypothetical protein